MLSIQHSQGNTSQSFIPINHLSDGLESPFWNSLFLKLASDLSLGWICTKQQPFQESYGSHFSISTADSTGLDEAVLDTKYCDSSW